ncbi:MAG: hypothetical protein ACOYK8_05395 [Alphaproteobacteria bacterium]
MELAARNNISEQNSVNSLLYTYNCLDEQWLPINQGKHVEARLDIENSAPDHIEILHALIQKSLQISDITDAVIMVELGKSYGTDHMIIQMPMADYTEKYLTTKQALYSAHNPWGTSEFSIEPPSIKEQQQLRDYAPNKPAFYAPFQGSGQLYIAEQSLENHEKIQQTLYLLQSTGFVETSAICLNQEGNNNYRVINKFPIPLENQDARHEVNGFLFSPQGLDGLINRQLENIYQLANHIALPTPQKTVLSRQKSLVP